MRGIAGEIAGACACGPAGGAGGASEPNGAPCGEPAHGDRSQLTTPIGAAEGPAIDAPQTCDDPGHNGPGTYIRVRGHGQRQIQMGREAMASCPEPPATPTGCVFADDFGRAVIARLGAQGIRTIGLGLGACGRIDGDYDAWNISVSILDWAHADAAIAAVDAELRERDVANHFGITVRGIGCAVPE